MPTPQRIDEIQATELRSILDEELGRLPERHRAAIILCELEGLSRREAAGRLGVSEGTLSSRLARAKVRLRERLTRRGLALTAAALATTLTHDIQALTVPPSLVESTIRIATMVATRSSLAEVASTSVATLTEGVLKAMLLSKLKLAFLGLVTVAIVTAGAGVVAQDAPSDNDRLRNLERKVDRLLEVLGRSGQRPTSPQPATASTAEPAPAAPAAPVAPAVPAAPAAIAPVPPPPRAHSTPSAAAPSPAPAALPVQPASPVTVVPARTGQSGSVGRRIDSLEQRLAKLEQRLAEVERRLGNAGVGSLSAPVTRIVTEPPPSPRGLAPTGTTFLPPPAPAAAAAPASGNPPAQGAPTPIPSAAPASAPAGSVLLPPRADLLDRPSLADNSAAEDSPAQPPPPASPEALLRTDRESESIRWPVPRQQVSTDRWPAPCMLCTARASWSSVELTG